MSTSTTRKRVVLYQHQPISSQSHSLARRACKIALEAVSKQLTRSVSEGGGQSRVESPSLFGLFLKLLLAHLPVVAA